MKKLILAFMAIVAFSSNASLVEQDGCFTKLKQVMKPEYPAARISGYAIVNFDIKKDGGVKNIRSHKSMCLRHNRKEDTYAFSSCGVFISKAIAASRYIEFKPPVDKNGNTCSIQNNKHLYRFVTKKDNKIEKVKDAFIAELGNKKDS